MNGRGLTLRLSGWTAETSGPSRVWRRVGVPISWPETRTVGEPPPEPRLQTENSSSGACGAHACQAAITAFACAQRHEAEKVETVEIAVVLKRYSVAIPKLPPPPPRLAQ